MFTFVLKAEVKQRRRVMRLYQGNKPGKIRTCI